MRADGWRRNICTNSDTAVSDTIRGRRGQARRGCGGRDLRISADCTLTLIGDGGWGTPETAVLAAALQAHPELTAAGTFTDIFAAQLLEAARAVGRRVPEELSVVGFANMSDPAILSHGITSLEQHAGKLAEAAVTALFDRIAAPEAPWQEIRVVPELVVKKTTAPPRRR